MAALGNHRLPVARHSLAHIADLEDHAQAQFTQLIRMVHHVVQDLCFLLLIEAVVAQQVVALYGVADLI